MIVLFDIKHYLNRLQFHVRKYKIDVSESSENMVMYGKMMRINDYWIMKVGSGKKFKLLRLLTNITEIGALVRRNYLFFASKNVFLKIGFASLLLLIVS